MADFGIGLVGSGFMGAAHVFALATADRVFELPGRVRFALIADASLKIAERAAGRFGFERATENWRDLVDDPAVSVVHITAPNALHIPIAEAAIAANKPVHCEKPLANDAAAAHRIADLAEAAGVVTIVGFNYLKNPIQALARDLIAAGEIGEPIGFRGIHAEDYYGDPEAPFSWRHEEEGGGVVMDLGSHVVSLARFLIGPVARVSASSATVHKERPDGTGGRRAVAVDEFTSALIEFENGAAGSFQASWLSPGRSMQLAYEIIGTRGSIAFTQERFNELRLFTRGGPSPTAGFRTIHAGPDHPPYGAFCPAPGHQLGFNDLKAIEMRDFLLAVAEGRPAFPDFREAARIQTTIDAIRRSARERQWVDVE